MKILAIESSCDETAVAVVENGTQVLSNVIYSQIKIHQKYGGVVPELASRMHTEKINKLIAQALSEADLSFADLDACAVTYGPGLEGALLIGITAAKQIAQILDIPLIGVNHLHGHIYANFLDQESPKFPFICLIVSGGHTLLVLVTGHFKFECLGQTRDDAAGEAFDKVARFLDLGYPGGPIVEEMAKKGNPDAYSFPRPMLKKGFEFSFSGLKTAVIQALIREKEAGKAICTEDVCASFQKAVFHVLEEKLFKATKKHNCKTVIISGGVAANRSLLRTLQSRAEKEDVKCICPPPILCTDNAGMIGAAAFFQITFANSQKEPISVKPNLEL